MLFRGAILIHVYTFQVRFCLGIFAYVRTVIALLPPLFVNALFLCSKCHGAYLYEYFLCQDEWMAGM